MSKGMTPVIVAVLMVIIVVASSVSYMLWGQGVLDVFENTTEDLTGHQMNKSSTRFAIVNAAGSEVAIKNKGKSLIRADEMFFYLNSTPYNSAVTDPPGGTVMNPGDVFIFQLAPAPAANIYEIRATGPYGLSDIIVAPMG